MYLLTEKGLALTPVLLELALCSDGQLRTLHPNLQQGAGIAALRNDKVAFANAIQTNYRKKLAAIKGQTA